MAPLHSSLGNRVRLHPKRKNRMGSKREVKVDVNCRALEGFLKGLEFFLSENESRAGWLERAGDLSK